MFGNKKRKIPISKDDIKQAIKKANDRLKAENSKIDSKITGAKNTFKDIQNNIKDSKKELKRYENIVDSRISESHAIGQQISSIKADLKKMSSTFEKELVIEESLQSSVLALSNKESRLLKSVKLLEDKKSDSNSINQTLRSLKKELKMVTDELSSLNTKKNTLLKNISNLSIESKEADIIKVKLLDDLEAFKAKAKLEMDNLESVLKEKTDHFNSESTRIDNIIAERLEEMETNSSLAKMKAGEYKIILSKTIAAENKIIALEEKSKNIVKRQEDQIKGIKERFEVWKLTQLDKVAKLKLKGKIDNIDKAGLKELLDV